MEEWRAVVGHEGFYEVSDHGRVRRMDYTAPMGTVERRYPARMLRTQLVQGYPTVGLWRPVARHVGTHILVLEAFVGPRPAGAVAMHIDGTRDNSLTGNLRWGTQSENMLDACDLGSRPRGSAYWAAKLSDEDVSAIRIRLTSGERQRSIAIDFGVTQSTVSRIKTNTFRVAA